MNIKFKVLDKSRDDRYISFPINRVLIVGYAGRDIKKTMEHIRELELELQVPPPHKIPTIFECSRENLTQEKNIRFVGRETSGEVEHCIIKHNGEIFIGIGSDHTDRKLESLSVPKAKQVAPKPIGKYVIPYRLLKDHWDDIELASYQTVAGEEILYQMGVMKDILPVEFIIKELEERVGDINNCIIFSGTVPLKDGFKYGTDFRGIIRDKYLECSISVEYHLDIIEEEER